MACSLCISMFAASALNGSDPSNRTIFSVSSLISRDNLLYLKRQFVIVIRKTILTLIYYFV